MLVYKVRMCIRGSQSDRKLATINCFRQSLLLETEGLQIEYFRKDRKQMGDSRMNKMYLFYIEKTEYMLVWFSSMFCYVKKSSQRRWKLTVILVMHYTDLIAAKEI